MQKQFIIKVKVNHQWFYVWEMWEGILKCDDPTNAKIFNSVLEAEQHIQDRLTKEQRDNLEYEIKDAHHEPIPNKTPIGRF